MEADLQKAATQLLRSTHTDDKAARDQLLPLVYDELRQIASRLLRRDINQTLQATALVHEAWMRMIDPKEIEGQDRDELRRRFLGLAARAMRWVIVDRARERKAEKRGGDLQRITFCSAAIASPENSVDLLEIDEALTKLEEFKPRLARLAELRLFGGLSTQESAAALQISRSLATDEWALARSLLSQSLAP